MPPPQLPPLFLHDALPISPHPRRSRWHSTSRRNLTTILSATSGRLRSRSISQCNRPEVADRIRSEEHTSELQSLRHLVCRLLLEKQNLHQLPLHRSCTGST